MTLDERDDRPVMAAIDFSFDADDAAVYAAAAAHRLNRPLALVHVARIPTPVGPTIAGGPTIRRQLTRARAGLRDVADKLTSNYPSLSVTTTVLVGEPVETILTRSGDAFALVIGARGLGGHSMLRWGSVSNRVVSRAQCPVIVVRSSARVPHTGPIVVVADTPAHGDAAAMFAEAFSGGHATYRVSVHPDSDRSDVDLGTGALPLDSVIVLVMPGDGRLNVAVCHAAADYGATLIVLAHERHTWPFRLGSDSAVHDLIEMSDCPVAVVDGAATRSPDRLHVGVIEARSPSAGH